uniref:Uncharacterized protein n=1 Tax=viral metagenome TaxID=1070528 RepID=A0A6H1ZT09_9ZZZZ
MFTLRGSLILIALMVSVLGIIVILNTILYLMGMSSCARSGVLTINGAIWGFAAVQWCRVICVVSKA